MQDKYITVTQLTKYIKFKIDNDEHLNFIFLKGEISNFKAHSRGHFYFTIKDENTRINAVMFASSASKVKFMPQDGMKVLVTGKVSVYEATGGYQIYVNEMIEDGVGNLYIQFEQLKAKLEKEGLFNPEHKKKIPKIPRKIGIITAPTGAAIRDILSTIKRRWPIAETILFPSLVQGAEAASDIVRQIEEAQNYDLDVLLVGRGGGSIEDMWCFNDEMVARAIYDCSIPTISAVGHEIDFTIADFVADLRAPTPTGAAEMAVPNQQDFYNYLNQIHLRLNKGITNKINNEKQKLKALQDSYILKNPLSIYEVKEQKFDNLLERIELNMQNILEKSRNKLENLESSYILKNPMKIYEIKKIAYENTLNNLKNISKKQLLEKNKNFATYLAKLETLNPLNTITRGYAILKKEDKVISSVKNIKKGDNLEINVKDGTIYTQVLKGEKHGKENN